MDPVAHTLVGAAMAEAGLKKCSRYATATLLIGVNLPDIDAVATLWGSDTALHLRRGWTHGVLAMVLLPLLLAGAVWLWHRWRGHRKPDAPPLRMDMIVLLSYLAVLSHPLLDWMNTYGVRLLMPFDDTWFYGDTLFIVDPWVWLLAVAGVVLARSATRPAMAFWGIAGALATGLILTTDVAPLGVKLLWLLGIGIIVGLRWWRPSLRISQGIAQISFAALLVYISMAYGMARVAEQRVAEQYPEPLQVQANPMPGLPQSHRQILVYEDLYRVVMADGEVLEIPREEPGPVVQRALEAEEVRGFVGWMRFPYWEVEETEDGWRVTLKDLRYVIPGEPAMGIGRAQVRVARDEVPEAD